MKQENPAPRAHQVMATAEDIRRIFGPIDDVVMIPLLEVGATPAEVAEAEAWLSNSQIGKTLAYGCTGRVAMLIEILRDSDWIADER